MKRWLIGVIAGGAAVVLAGGATAFAMNGQTAVPEPTPTVVAVVIETPKPVTPTPTPEPVVEVAVPVVPVLEEVPPPPPAPELCPSGTIAQHVDEFGNESNCHELNDQGQQCVKYGENDQCVAWLES